MIRIRGDLLVFPPEVAEKLWQRHGLTEWEVREVINDPDVEPPRWDNDLVHGGRAILRGYTGGAEPKMVYVALRPIDWRKGVWAVITAFVPEDEEYRSDKRV